MEWGFNYLENLLVPLDNYISRGTEVFLTCKDPNYHAMVGGLLCPGVHAASATPIMHVHLGN